MVSDARIDELRELINSSNHAVAFTGAGVSTLSGIRDFRGKDGLYKTVDADRMFDVSVFRREPAVYYSLAKDFIYGLDGKTPSAVHLALAALEARGRLRAIITQNIDLLHQKAGSRRVIELHGSPATHRCPACGYRADFANVAPVARQGNVPRCPNCKAALKPDIVFFGESLPRQALIEAEREARAADLMLVLGSSLLVHPAAEFPAIAVDSGAKLVIVNDQATYLDDRALLRFDDLEAVFSAPRLLRD